MFFVSSRFMNLCIQSILFFLFALSVWAGEPFCFVQLTDLHLGQGDHFTRAEQAVAEINALPMDIRFVAITGDIVDGSITDTQLVGQVVGSLKKLTAPVHFLPGNHDILKENVAETVAAYIHHFGPLITSAEYNGVRCVFAFTEPLTGQLDVAGYDPFREIEPLLKGAETLVFHHTPSVDSFYSGKVHPGWGRTATGRRWIHLLNQYGVKAVIAGHFHRDEQHWLGSVPLYIAPPLSGRFGRQPTFRVYTYQNGRLSYQTVYVQ